MLEHIARWLKKRGRYRMIPRDGNEKYLERFYILSTSWVGIYLHCFWADDDDGLHDHPWNSMSLPLRGGFFEEIPEDQNLPCGPTINKFRRPLIPVLRSKYAAHRITLPSGQEGKVWSLFIRFGFKRRKWGFYRNGIWQPAEVQSRKEINEGLVTRNTKR